MMMKHFKLIIKILLLLPYALSSENINAPVTIVGALEQFKTSKIFECGHPVYLQVFLCVCDPDESTANEKAYEHPRNNDYPCAENNKCFHVSSKHLKNSENSNRTYGICKLGLSPNRISKHVQLTNPKTFNILKLDGNDQNILLSSKYTSLVYNNDEFKIQCMTEIDYSRANQPGWYFWFKDDTETIFKTNYSQSFNSDKEVNFEKLCWFQLGNENAIMNKIAASDPLTNDVCNGNEYGLNLWSVIGLHRKGSVLKDGDVSLPGIEVKARSVKFIDKLAEFHHGCKLENIEHNSNFIPWFEGVYCKDEKIYLKINSNVIADRNDVPIAVWDQSGHEVMQEKSVLLGKFVALSLHGDFSNSVGNKVLVCIYVSRSSNWCEHLDIKNASESELQEYRDYVFSTLSPSTSTQTIVTLKESKTENSTESDSSNSTDYYDLDIDGNSMLLPVVVCCAFLVLAVPITAILIRRYGYKCIKNLLNRSEEMELSESEALHNGNPAQPLNPSSELP